MNFNDYQTQAKTTAKYPDVENNLYYPALGLGGEVGEIQNKIKKIMRDNEGILKEEVRQDLISELGDVLWYCAALASELKVDLDEVARRNVDKLASRKERGTLHGSGDNR
jgi:NTP pyrophosphatase (non-canonical NTP hydrolase)